MLQVESYCAYLTGTFADMRNEDYSGQKFVKLLKNRSFKGSCSVPHGAGTTRLSSGDFAGACGVFAAWCQQHLPTGSAFAIIPVPNKIAIVGGPATFPTLEIAKEVAALSRLATAIDAVRWTQQLPTSNSGAGSRQRWYLRSKMQAQKPTTTRQCVLIDDNYTTGGSMGATADALAAQGWNVLVGLSAGRTVHEQLAQPYALTGLQI